MGRGVSGGTTVGGITGVFARVDVGVLVGVPVGVVVGVLVAVGVAVPVGVWVGVPVAVEVAVDDGVPDGVSWVGVTSDGVLVGNWATLDPLVPAPTVRFRAASVEQSSTIVLPMIKRICPSFLMALASRLTYDSFTLHQVSLYQKTA